MFIEGNFSRGHRFEGENGLTDVLYQEHNEILIYCTMLAVSNYTNISLY